MSQSADPSPASPEPSRPPRWQVALADLPVLALSLSLLVLLGRTFAGRVGYPFDLEWMEGGMLLHALRVRDGLPLYTTPSPEWIPFIYPPLYSWVVGLLGHVFPLDYALGRSVSMAGTLCAAGALVAGMRGEKASWALSIGAAALFLGTYEDAGSFFDLVRIDGLFLAAWAWSMVAVRRGWLRSAGLLLTLAFATKHNAAIFGVPAVVWLWSTRGRADAVRFALWSVLPALAFTIGMLGEGDGLFLTYLLGVPAGHPFVVERLLVVAPKEMFLALPLTTVLAAAIGAWRFKSAGPGAGWWVSVSALAIAFSAVMRGHHGGYLNVLIPGLWGLSLLGGLGACVLTQRFPGLPARAFAGGLIAAQIWLGRWSLDRFVPTSKDVEAGQRVIDALADVDGEVLAPWSPWYPVKAGKAPAFHLIALWDVDHERGPLVEHVAGIRDAVETHRWDAVLVSGRDGGLKYGLREHYVRDADLTSGGKALMPRTGWRVRPRYLYRPVGQ